MLTRIKFEDNYIKNIDITTMPFIPNRFYDKLVKLVAKEGEERVEMINNSAYHTQRSYIKNEKINEFKYPVVYTVNSENKPIFYYSNTNKNGHFGIPKVIWSNGRISSIGSYIDFKGKVGLTQFAYAIVDAPENLPSIKKAFDCIELRNLMEASAVGLLTVNQKVLSLFRKDFWKDFL